MRSSSTSPGSKDFTIGWMRCCRPARSILRRDEPCNHTFEEQVRARLISVANGRKSERRIPPPGHAGGRPIFETTGAWEDYATPSRDLRLLIALDVVREFPQSRRAGPSGTRCRGKERSRR